MIFRGLLFFLFVSVLHILNLDCITSNRTFMPNGGHRFQSRTEQSTLTLQTSLSLNNKVSIPYVVENKEERENHYKEVSKIGSSPPSCQHKCFGCMPCEAIQVPTTTSSHVGVGRVQYANYEPEGWKCKCGTTFYTP
ncbi:hypothetical protein ACH5RR_024382 [Cinchona calisaya]|uniref:Epidermal patterning factor-like protein n=1 Tax=Cinchona calisaya TaxID=153742 RepID=A0ABD2YZY1_9GENT